MTARCSRYAVAPYLKLPIDQAAVNSVTRGLVGDTSFAVLPEISSRVTFVLTLVAQMVRCFRSSSTMSRANCRSHPWSRSFCSLAGTTLWEQSHCVAMLPSCLAGTSMKRRSCLSSSRSVCSHSRIDVTWELFGRLLFLATYPCFLCCSPHRNSLSRQFTPSSGLCCFWWHSKDLLRRKCIFQVLCTPETC